MKNEPVPLVDRHAAIAIHPAAVAIPDAARAGAHLVLQVAEGQRLRGQFAVDGVGAGNRTTNQVHVTGIDLVAAITIEQAGLLANTLSVAVSTPRGSERHLHPAAYLAVPGHASRSL